ncbi:MAG: hypothetical protein GDA36_01760 [Rhodobacteraceae bacterium]|nr:hypothetical protein [Paracoccaceae bacterium]
MVFADMQAAGWGVPGPGLRVMVRCNCLLIGQWHPEAGSCALNCGLISCCVAVSIFLQLCPMRRPVAVFAIHDDLLACAAVRSGISG